MLLISLISPSLFMEILQRLLPGGSRDSFPKWRKKIIPNHGLTWQCPKIKKAMIIMAGVGRNNAKSQVYYRPQFGLKPI
jgi:hypothetical protein